MARRKKGKVPAHLRPFLFRKGHRSARSAAPSPPQMHMARRSRRTRSTTRRTSAPRGANSFLGSIKQDFVREARKFRPIEGLLNFGLGAKLDVLLDSSGISDAIYTASVTSAPPFAQWMNAQRVNSGYSGGKAINKLIGGLTGLGLTMKSAVFGKHLNSADLSARGPYVLGTLFDAPEGPQGGPMGAGALTALGGNAGSSMPSGGWV